jgi:acyl-CoA synthetase (NDP forming)
MTTPLSTVFDKLFYPKSIAVVGASQNLVNLGSRHVQQLQAFGYSGDLFAVNPRAERSCGVPGYRRVLDIPQSIDFCVIVTPAKTVVEVVTDCVAKGVPVAQILTGGFGETGAAGQRLEQALVDAAAGVTRLVGPNCMGVYSAPGGLTMVATADQTVGSVSVGSQSGGLSMDIILQAKARGLALNKVVSMGNCIDLDPVDFLQYFAADPETEVIGLYLEGLERGKAFFATLKAVTTRKPVVLLKGGRTRLGAQSVASHTNALAGEYAIWQAAMTQAGVLMVETVDELLATLSALQPHVPRPRGPGVALVGNGGGTTVLTTDVVEEAGLTLAPLRSDTKAALAAIDMPAGATVGNPTDTPIGALNKGGGAALGQVMHCLLQDADVHGLVVHFNLGAFINYDNRHDIADGVADALRSVAAGTKPVYVALRATPDPAIEAVRTQILATTRQLGLPCFHSPHEAVQTFAAVYRWHRMRFKV